MKLQTKLNILIISTFVVLTGIISALQIHWADKVVIERASDMMRQNINAAWQLIDASKERVETTAALLSHDEVFCNAKHAEDENCECKTWKERWRLDILQSISRTPSPDEHNAGLYLYAKYKDQITNNCFSGIATVPYILLDQSAPKLAERCRVGGQDVDGMFIFSIAISSKNDRAIVSGILLNGASYLADKIQNDIFKDEFYDGRRAGTATIFKDTIRVATTVLLKDGERATGTRVSDEVARHVLEKGNSWTGRAKVVDNWYLSRYDPIRNPANEVIGMLYIGTLEQIYLDIRHDMVLSNIGATIVIMTVMFVFGMLMTNRILNQLEALKQGAKKFANSEFSARVSPTTEDETGELAHSFNWMAEKIEEDRNEILRQQEEIRQANRNYIDLLGFVTHELRSSLAAAIFNVQLLQDGSYGELQSEAKEGVDTVSSTLNYLNDITLNYLQLSRIESGRLMLSRAETYVSRDIVTPLIRDLSNLAERSKITIQNNIAEDIVVAADVALLRIVYQNFLINALKFGRHDGTIKLGAKRLEGHVEFTVWNDGKGIKPDVIPLLFKKFQHFDVDEKEGRKGSGLGLFIVKRIIDQHGGTIEVESKEDEYACFRFTILY